MIGLIWAQAHDRVIGRDGGMPWHLPEDLAHFRAVTDGATVLMGRRTWDSLPERFRPLPGRRNHVLTRDTSWTSPGAEPVHDLNAVLATATAASPLWVIGGAELYAATIAHADRLELTEIALDVPDGDTLAPELPEHLVPATPDPAWLTSRTGLHYRFCTYTRP